MVLLLVITFGMGILLPILARVWGWTYNGWFDPKGKFHIGYDGSMGIIGVMLGFLLAVVVQAGLFVFIEPEYELVETSRINIEGLKDNSNINGSFVLGSGTINEEQYYYFMKKTSFGLQMDKIEALRVPLKESNNESPALVTLKERLNNKWNNLFWVGRTGNEITYLVVPEKTVTKEFTVDME